VKDIEKRNECKAPFDPFNDRSVFVEEYVGLKIADKRSKGT